jgi:metallo-beta-lactamase class B
MGRKTFISLLVVLLCLGLSMTAMAQTPVQDPAKMWTRSPYPLYLKDTQPVKDAMAYARQLAGDDWYFLQIQRLQCADVDESNTVVQTPGSNNNDSWNPNGWKEVPAVPTKVFDNVYYVGGMEVGGWIIDTGDGYIMLDTSYAYGLDTILLPNMAKLGLNPAKIKYILITHGSVGAFTADHSGTVQYFNNKYGTKVVLSAQEAASSNPALLKNRTDDIVVGSDGKKLTLGNTTITMVHTPRSYDRNTGAVGGGLSYFIPVKIQGKRHMWATYGNTGINVGSVKGNSNVELYLKSMAKFLGYVDSLKPDIAISSHPFVDGSIRRMELIRECDDRHGRHNFGRHDQCGPHNPFLIGREGARRYFEIMNQCAVVRQEREKAGLSANGLGCPDVSTLDTTTGICVCPTGSKLDFTTDKCVSSTP